ncbi:hypothetical protein NDU88_003046 [Pleurodeles waltl]|uniref:Uncharacterized protein n=1 Tax=Pleurodeles waltl TaxID=8319 RepID=A0AAV7SEV5_PLEWA|nr:hypothetical protein NDU88_003046 [Pleurodeles waltl]
MASAKASKSTTKYGADKVPYKAAESIRVHATTDCNSPPTTVRLTGAKDKQTTLFKENPPTRGADLEATEGKVATAGPHLPKQRTVEESGKPGYAQAIYKN